MSLTLLLLAFLAYFNYAAAAEQAPPLRLGALTRGRPRSAVTSMVLCVVAYIASCLARPSAIGFPFVLLLVDYYPLRRR